MLPLKHPRPRLVRAALSLALALLLAAPGAASAMTTMFDVPEDRGRDAYVLPPGFATDGATRGDGADGAHTLPATLRVDAADGYADHPPLLAEAPAAPAPAVDDEGPWVLVLALAALALATAAASVVLVVRRTGGLVVRSRAAS